MPNPDPKYLHLCFEPLIGTDRRIEAYEEATGEHGKVCDAYGFKKAASSSPLVLRIDTNSPVESEIRSRIIDSLHSDPAPAPGQKEHKPGERGAAVDYRDFPPAPPPPETEAEALEALYKAGAKLIEGRKRVDAALDAEAKINPALKEEMNFNRRLDEFGSSIAATTTYLGETGFFDNYSYYHLADSAIIDAMERHRLIPTEVATYFRAALSKPLTGEQVNRLNKDGVLQDEYVTPLKRAVLGLKDTVVTLEPVGGLKERIESEHGRMDDNFNANRLPATSPFCVKLQADFFHSDRMERDLEWNNPHEREQILRQKMGDNPELKREMELKQKFRQFTHSSIAKSSHLTGGGVSLDETHYYRASPELLEEMDRAGLIVPEDRDKLKAAVAQSPAPVLLKSLEETGLLHPKFVEVMAKSSPSNAGPSR